MPLIRGEFKPGSCREYVQTIQDEDLKSLAEAEYFYFTGQPEKAVTATEKLFKNPDVVVKLSACLVYCFANLSLGKIQLTELGLNTIRESLRMEIDKTAMPHFKAVSVLIATTATVLLHEKPPKEKLIEHIKYLPRGLQLWGCYLVAHTSFLDKEYSKAVGVTETIISLPAIDFPIAMIYLHLSAAINLMALRQVEEAKKHFLDALRFAQPDKLIQPFAENHALLCGLVENCLKTQEPELYKEIIDISNKFTSGWRRVHNNRMKKTVTYSLTTTEFAIAMLANRGWSNLEIADYMGFSLHTVKRYISIIYQKLGITNRSELKRFIHQ